MSAHPPLTHWRRYCHILKLSIWRSHAEGNNQQPIPRINLKMQKLTDRNHFNTIKYTSNCGGIIIIVKEVCKRRWQLIVITPVFTWPYTAALSTKMGGKTNEQGNTGDKTTQIKFRKMLSRSKFHGIWTISIWSFECSSTLPVSITSLLLFRQTTDRIPQLSNYNP